MHQWEEKQEECINCGATTISKSLNSSFVTKVKYKVGDLTNEYIESNKEVLKELQKEAKKENYE